MSACVSDLAFLLGPLQDPLLDGPLTDEAIDGDLLGLTQPVSSVHGLLVHRGVPVAVVEDDLEESISTLLFFFFLCSIFIVYRRQAGHDADTPLLCDSWELLRGMCYPK